MMFKIFNYLRNLFYNDDFKSNNHPKENVTISTPSSILDSENEDSDFDENGFIKSQEALIRRKKKLQKEWLQEMPKILEEYLSANNHIFQKYEEKPTQFQIHNHIFDFFPFSEVLVIDGTEIKYVNIIEVRDYFERVWGPDHKWEDSTFCIDILLEDNSCMHINIDFDPYNVSIKLLENLVDIERKNRK
ncbi:MAG: hypothetical protein MJZ86_07820 [Bacteroidales bacterium]|nr:hypothetical protein [Bacteroidales bacterium]